MARETQVRKKPQFQCSGKINNFLGKNFQLSIQNPISVFPVIRHHHGDWKTEQQIGIDLFSSKINSGLGVKKVRICAVNKRCIFPSLKMHPRKKFLRIVPPLNNRFRQLFLHHNKNLLAISANLDTSSPDCRQNQTSNPQVSPYILAANHTPPLSNTNLVNRRDVSMDEMGVRLGAGPPKDGET